MSRIAYVNGQYVPHDQAVVHVEDRGYQFADGVYEVCAILNGRLLDEDPHLDRLARSLRELRIATPMARGPFRVIMRQMVTKNRIRNGLLYIQVTRGVARRDHPFPAEGTRPALVMTAKAMDFGKIIDRASSGIAVITQTDQRWARRDIKSIALLPNILAKQQAREAGAFEAWLVDGNGHVTEGSSTNAWIVTRDGVIVTRALGPDILPGITRLMLLEVIRDLGLKLEERSFTVAEAKDAREAFITSSTAFALPVVQIDGHPVGNGEPGLAAQDLIRAYWKKVMAETGVTRTHLPNIPA
ncbi:D-amino-acid transaminase [Govanella unica]|uniref:Probable branched-chain-amino-acid aminotransferase n=1 Tax=Govanella unica TaxID=2975056 RepID=A0A9X3TZA5_9PROT|nr:D-amino-acid transaminase [Govania unica]MDA5194705.1 D-amino-acid transaminase [Govania unica]